MSVKCWFVVFVICELLLIGVIALGARKCCRLWDEHIAERQKKVELENMYMPRPPWIIMAPLGYIYIMEEPGGEIIKKEIG
jgi:hypothetical protein